MAESGVSVKQVYKSETDPDVFHTFLSPIAWNAQSNKINFFSDAQIHLWLKCYSKMSATEDERLLR